MQIKIAHVDDESINLTTFASISEALDKSWNIISFTDPIKALTEIVKLQPNLIISDMKMPSIDGSLFANLAFRLVPFSKIVYLSSLPRENVKSEIHKNFYYLRKPIDRDLVGEIERILEEDIDVSVHPVVRDAIEWGMLNHIERKPNIDTFIDDRASKDALSEEKKLELKQLIRDFPPREVLERNPLCMFGGKIGARVFTEKQVFPNVIAIDDINTEFIPDWIEKKNPDIRLIGEFLPKRAQPEWNYTQLLFNLKSRTLHIQGMGEKLVDPGKYMPDQLWRRFSPFETCMLAEHNFAIYKVWKILKDFEVNGRR